MLKTSDEIEQDFELVVWSMQRFNQSDPEYRRLQHLRNWCNRHGAAREGFPPGTEQEYAVWQDLVSECRRMAQ